MTKLAELEQPELDKVVGGALREARGKIGRPTAIPGVEVIDVYPSGQAKTYKWKGKLINRRTYFRMLKQLKEKGYEP